uniref:ORFX n=1 Tax=Minke whale astrovirus 2 TaxID=943161 RepID=F1D811_9VIRU|nr:ORFX [Minke whale astrovirus 2]
MRWLVTLAKWLWRLNQTMPHNLKRNASVSGVTQEELELLEILTAILESHDEVIVDVINRMEGRLELRLNAWDSEGLSQHSHRLSRPRWAPLVPMRRLFLRLKGFFTSTPHSLRRSPGVWRLDRFRP